MNSWRPYPLLRLLFPFLAGIIIERAVGPHLIVIVFPTAFMALLLVSTRIFTLKLTNYRLRWISGIMINGFLLLAGYEIAATHRSSSDPAYLGGHPEGLFIATIDEPPARNGTSLKAILNVRYRRETGHWVRTCGRAMGYLELKTTTSPLQYGDFILLHTGFTEITDNSNPHGFNYAVYLKKKASHTGDLQNLMVGYI